MKVALKYGKKDLVLNLPDNIPTDVVEPKNVKGLPDPEGSISWALQNPVNYSPLSQCVSVKDTVGIVFSDITRATPYHIMIPAILKKLSHLPKENIIFFCALGTHREAPPEELETILGKDIIDNYKIVQNNSSDRSLHSFMGTTISGNRIFLNSELMNCSLRILTGFIEPHFFAGFSGGGKALMPGMAHEDTIRFNHSIDHLDNPNTRWGITTGNPLWEDVMEAADLAQPVFLLNVTLNRSKEITGVFAGDLFNAHKEGCRFAKDTAMNGLEEAYDIVITSNSGYPLVLNVYQSVKGMSAAERVVKKGGSIIIAAECWDGIPSNSDYEKILHSVDNQSQLMSFVKKHETDFKDTWQVYFQAMIQEKADVYLYSELDHKTVKSCLLNPVRNIDLLVDRLVEKYGNDSRLCVLPLGPWTIPYII